MFLEMLKRDDTIGNGFILCENIINHEWVIIDTVYWRRKSREVSIKGYSINRVRRGLLPVGTGKKRGWEYFTTGNRRES